MNNFRLLNHVIKIFFLFIFVSNAFAALPVDLKTQSPRFLQSLPNIKEISRATDFNHTLHIRIQQMYAGYPIWGADAVVHYPNNHSAITMNGILFKNIKEDIGEKPHLALNAHQSEKLFTYGLQKYREKYTEITDITQKTITPIIYIDKNNKAHTAFHFSLRAKQSGSIARPNWIIDTNSFEVYKMWNNLQTHDPVLMGGLGGNKKIGQFIYDGLSPHYSALNILRSSDTQTCYLQNNLVTLLDNVGPTDRIATFHCPERDPQHNNLYWHGTEDAANGAYSPENDALFAAKKVTDMYQDWYHIPPLTKDNQPMMIVIRLHLTGFENAFWENGRVTLGDGWTDSYPWASLGVIAHELSHGFTEQHSHLVYEGQSGGLNEAFSDMAATAAEYYVTQKNNWKIGFEILKDPNQALRYMDEPTKDCQDVPAGSMCSISNAKDYKDSLNVHYTSGVFNKFFYLLATSPQWNIQKAFNVMVQANQHYWTSTSTFIESACGVLKAAKDYGYDKDSVIQAANGVGININQC